MKLIPDFQKDAREKLIMSTFSLFYDQNLPPSERWFCMIQSVRSLYLGGAFFLKSLFIPVSRSFCVSLCKFRYLDSEKVSPVPLI